MTGPVSRAEYEDVAAAIRVLTLRVNDSDQALMAAIMTIRSLIEFGYSIAPEKIEEIFAEIRKKASDAEAGASEAGFAKAYKWQLNLFAQVAAAHSRNPPH